MTRLLRVLVAVSVLVVTCALLAPRAIDAAPAPAPSPARPPAAPVNDRWPRFSPDGSRIAFASNRDGSPGLYVMASDGSDLHKVPVKASPGTNFFGPSWLSTTMLLFSGARPTLASGADNGLEATEFVEADTAGNGQRILQQGINQEGPAGSPSGDKLVYAAEHGPYQSNPKIDLYEFDIDTMDLHALTHEDGQYGQAAWSPDGSKIAYICLKDGAPSIQICVMDEDGTNVRQITSGDGSHQWPTWSPDAKRIAFFLESKLDGQTDSNIAIINTDGTGERLITHHDRPQRDETPSWSHDGKHIAFQTDRQGGRFRIVVMDADGANVTMLTR